MTLRNAFENLATEPKQDTANTLLADILTELGQKLEAGGTVALDVATLLALENINAAITGTVAVSNPTADPEVGLAKEVTLASILTELGQKLEAGQAVALDAATLAALETISVANFPATQQVAGTVTAVDHKERTLLHAVATVTAIGSTTVVTPAAGKFLRVWWVYAINDPTAETAPLIDVALGGVPVYRAWALSKSQRIEGAPNGALTVSLSAAGQVATSVIYEELTP